MNNKVTLNRESREDYFYNEAIKTLRTNIQFSGSNVHVIMMTSSVPDEGKSETTFALASAMAQIGNKVLLIDADIRKSVLASRYQLDCRVDGLSQYLSGQKQLTEVCYSTNVENLDMIFSGPYSPNPAELLEEPALKKLLEWARSEYDYVFIDTPPVGSVIDGAIVAPHCDGVIIVIESGTVSYKLVQKVKTQLERTGCRILGTVLNRVKVHEQHGYYRYYGNMLRIYRYYGKYGAYYRYDQGEKETD